MSDHDTVVRAIETLSTEQLRLVWGAMRLLRASRPASPDDALAGEIQHACEDELYNRAAPERFERFRAVSTPPCKGERS